MTDPAQAFREAVEMVGSQSATARLLGVSQASIWQRLSKRQPAAAQHVLTLERHTGISRHRLRPDLYPIHDSPAGRTRDGSGASIAQPSGFPGKGPCDRSAKLHLGEPLR
ncbi:MAG TPA: YdaS family helix-turn-helix protein [Allosphingosinicella sp.]|jgi:DNA-binding transcriptional regulator YdaS (Cro superfamily)